MFETSDYRRNSGAAGALGGQGANAEASNFRRRRRGPLNAELADFFDERRAPQPEDLGGLGDDAVGLVERLPDQPRLEQLEQAFEWQALEVHGVEIDAEKLAGLGRRRRLDWYRRDGLNAFRQV